MSPKGLTVQWGPRAHRALPTSGGWAPPFHLGSVPRDTAPDTLQGAARAQPSRQRVRKGGNQRLLPGCETPNGHGGLTRGGAGGRAVEGGPGSGQRGCREEVRASWAWARPSEARAHGRSVTPRSVPDPRFRLRTLPPPGAQCQPVIRSHITKETHGGQVSRPRSHLLGQEKPGRPCFLPAPSPHRPSQVFRVGPVPGLWGELGRRPLLLKGSRHRPSPQTKAPPGNLGSLCAGPRRSSPQVAPFPDMSLAGAGGRGEGQRERF